jgi:hypothetical protein
LQRLLKQAKTLADQRRNAGGLNTNTQYITSGAQRGFGWFKHNQCTRDSFEVFAGGIGFFTNQPVRGGPRRTLLSDTQVQDLLAEHTATASKGC